MGRWLDSFGVGIPMVEFETDSGQRVPVPRSEFARLGGQFGAQSLPEGAQSAFGQGSLAPPLPEIDLSAVNASDVAAAQLDAASVGGGPVPQLPGAGLGGMPQDNGIDAISGPGAPLTPPGVLAERQSRDTIAKGPAAGIQQYMADQQRALAEMQAQQQAAAQPVGGGQAVVTQETPEQAAASTQATQQAAYDPGSGEPQASPREEIVYGMADIEQQRSNAQLTAMQDAEMGIRIAEAQRQKDLERDQAEMSRLNREYEGLVNREAAARIDPGRKWASMGTGNKVLAVIGAVLSGAGSVLKKQGDKNPALDLLMAAFQEDIALQMDERAQMGRSAVAKRGQLDKFTEVAQTRDGVRLAGIATLAGRTAREIEMIAAKAENENVKFRAAELITGLREQQAAGIAGAVQSDFENTLKAREDERQERELQIKERGASGGGGGGGASIGKTAEAGGVMRFTDEQMQRMPRADRERMVRLPDKTWVPTNSKEAASKGTELLASSLVMVGNIDRALAKVTSMPGFGEKIAAGVGFEDSEIATIKQELTQLMLNGKNFYVLGALSENDEAIIKRLGADPGATTAFVENVWPKLQNWRNGIEQDALTQLSARGIDIKASDVYGAAPEKPRAKTVDEWTSDITSDPPELENEHSVSGGGETRTVKTYEYRVPTVSATKENLRGMRETALSDGWSDDKWSAHLDKIDRDHKLQAVRLAGKADGLDKRAGEIEKKGGKGKAEAVQLRKKAAAARSASADYQKLKIVVAEQRKAKIERDRKKADDANGQKRFREETTGSGKI